MREEEREHEGEREIQVLLQLCWPHMHACTCVLLCTLTWHRSPASSPCDLPL